MAAPSSLGFAHRSLRESRRSGDRTTAPTQQYVAFRLRMAWFILPMSAAYRVLPASDRPVPQLTLAGQPIPLLESHQLFITAKTGAATPLLIGGAPVADQPALIVVRDTQNRLTALLSDSQPALLRIASTDLVPVPPTYTQRYFVDFLAAMTLPAPPRPALLAIDPDRLGAIAHP